MISLKNVIYFHSQCTCYNQADKVFDLCNLFSVGVKEITYIAIENAFVFKLLTSKTSLYVQV